MKIFDRRFIWMIGVIVFGQATVGIVTTTFTHRAAVSAEKSAIIAALLPRDKSGHSFVLYSDCCSGTPGTTVAKNLQSVNEMVACIQPQPEFIAFPGDAVMGYTKDYDELRRQWNYWLGTEMKWARDRKLPLFQSTSNHNTYDADSEAVFRAVHKELPKNGPSGQQGLAYWFRHGNLLYVSTHQPDQRMLIDYVWLDRVLTDNSDAKFKFVVGHYPVFPVNGYITWPHWCFPPDQRQPFWELLVKHNVDAYLASHILAFDVQVHDNVLQILSGGAGAVFGSRGLMPGHTEYHHAVQLAVDEQGLRYQVRDAASRVREQLSWPFEVPPVDQWQSVVDKNADTLLGPIDLSRELVAFRIRGINAQPKRGNFDQTLVSGIDSGEGIEPIWIGLDGDSGRLLVRLVPLSEHGWQIWKGPLLTTGETFDLQVAFHPQMGPGGVLFRENSKATWSTLKSTSSKGFESLKRPQHWAVGHGQSGPGDRPFVDDSLEVSFTRITPKFE